jgi:uncharacterized membrane protein
MGKSRMEAFSDGVIAIIITIMVLEMKVPHGTDWAALRPILPVFLSYVLSYVYLGIYWNNHHHLLHAAKHVGGGVLWANLHLLFWLSLVPFVTGWMGENHFGSLPVAMFGVVLLGAAAAYTILGRIAKVGFPFYATSSPCPEPGSALGSRRSCTWRWPSSGWCPIAGSKRRCCRRTRSHER